MHIYIVPKTLFYKKENSKCQVLKIRVSSLYFFILFEKMMFNKTSFKITYKKKERRCCISRYEFILDFMVSTAVMERSAGAQWVQCQTANEAARVRIPANTNGFFLNVFLAPDGSEPT